MNQPTGTCLTTMADAAVEQLVRDYRPRLARYAAHLLGGDHALGEDVAQDVFERYLRQSDAQKQALNNGSVKAWLFTVCRNRALDLRRKDRRMTAFLKEKHLEEKLEEKQQQASASSASDDPALAALNRDMTQSVLRQLEALPSEQQEVIRLRFMGELTYAQIAQVTGLTAGNVGYLLHHGLKTLRQQLAPASEM